MRKLLNMFVRDEKGATAIEYGLIAALISVPMIVALPDIGTAVKNAFEGVKTAVGDGKPATTP
jgi:pilus assembly protein Flp/PilA